MGIKYDAKRHGELTEHKVALEKVLGELSLKLLEEYESDEWAGEKSHAKFMRYQIDQQRHGQVTREIQLAHQNWQLMEDLKPILNKRKFSETPNDAMRRWLHRGSDGLEQWERDIYLSEPTADMIQANPLMGVSRGNVFDPFAMVAKIKLAAGDPVRSDLDAGDDSALGLAAPETWAMGVVETLKFAGSVASSCRSITTESGNDHHQNALDTANEEGGAITDQTQVAGTGTPQTTHDQIGPATDIVFKAWIRHSNWMSQRLETITDIHFDVASRITRESSRRMGRGWNRWFTTGDGASKPEGIISAANVIKSGAIASSGISFANLLDMEYAVDLAYLIGNEGFTGGFMDEYMGMIGFMMNRNVEKILRNMRQPSSNLPVWIPNLESGIAIQAAPGRILGYPYSLNNHMDDGSSNDDIPILFGNFGHYCVRNIGGPMFYRFWDSATAQNYSVQYIGFSRRDGRTLGPVSDVDADFDANTADVKRCEAFVGLLMNA